MTEAAEPSSRDRFDENRDGLDHLSFSVDSHSALEEAIPLFDDRGISHGEIKDYGCRY